MRTVGISEDPNRRGYPPAYLSATAYPTPGHSELNEDRRTGGSILDSTRDIVNYGLAPSRIGDTMSTQAVYRFQGRDRESWGWHDEIRDLDETIGAPEALGDDIAWVRRDTDVGRYGDRERRDRWAILLPQFDSPTVTVYRTLPVIHHVGAVLPMLVLRAPFPLWIDERLF
jgi:hypothetical protein